MSRGGLASFRRMDEAESVLARRYIDRVADLRRARGLTQQEMADALGIPVERYKKYERRSLLPPILIERFAAIVGRDVRFVVTGKADGSRRGPKPNHN